MKKFFLGVLLLGLIGGFPLARAQDPLEVGPNIYKKVFENDRVRVMEIRFNPGDKIGMHSHPDHFVYIIDPGTLRLSYPDGTTKFVQGRKGEVLWSPAESHDAVNISATTLRGLVVELKK